MTSYVFTQGYSSLESSGLNFVAFPCATFKYFIQSVSLSAAALGVNLFWLPFFHTLGHEASLYLMTLMTSNIQFYIFWSALMVIFNMKLVRNKAIAIARSRNLLHFWRTNLYLWVFVRLPIFWKSWLPYDEMVDNTCWRERVVGKPTS